MVEQARITPTTHYCPFCHIWYTDEQAVRLAKCEQCGASECGQCGGDLLNVGREGS